MASLDVVIVNWNAGQQLVDCLESIGLAKTFPVFQLAKCIVVDNASSDGSANQLSQSRFNVQVVRNAENRGFGAACNQGAALAEGDYILFLNPDVGLFPDTLTKAISFLEESRSRSVGLLGVQLVDERCSVRPSAARFPTPAALIYQMSGLDRFWPSRFPPFVMTDWDHRESREVDILQGAFLLVRRGAFEQLAGFDERFFMYYEDVDLAYRARQAGWMSYYLAEAQAFHRGGGTTETIKATRLSYWFISRARYVVKHFGRLAALEVVLASLTLELGARLVWKLVAQSCQRLPETVDAYRKYLKTLPELTRD
jgi:GT2 family glycosyltransferase